MTHTSIESEAIKKELNDMKIDELIEDAGRFSYAKEVQIYFDIALATLRLHKAGNVMVPSEPTDEMVSTMEEMYYMPMGEMVAAYDGAVIIARPRTELDELLGGLK